MAKDREEMVRKLKSYTCRQHDKNATVMYEGDALEITACCDSFLKELEAVVAEENFRHGAPGPDNTRGNVGAESTNEML